MLKTLWLSAPKQIRPSSNQTFMHGKWLGRIWDVWKCGVTNCGKLESLRCSRHNLADVLVLDLVHRKGPKQRIRPQPKVTRNWRGRISEILPAQETPSWDVGLCLETTYLTDWTCTSVTSSAWCGGKRCGGHNQFRWRWHQLVRPEKRERIIPFFSPEYWYCTSRMKWLVKFLRYAVFVISDEFEVKGSTVSVIFNENKQSDLEHAQR